MKTQAVRGKIFVAEIEETAKNGKEEVESRYQY